MFQNILSLAKLSTLASDEPSESVEAVVNSIDVSLGIVNLQEELPQSVLTYLNQDADNMPVYAPARLIDVSCTSYVVSYVNTPQI
jgi:hypothetical protein